MFIALLVETRGKLDDLVATTSTTYTPIASSDTEACGNFIFALWTSITDIYFQSKYPASSATGNSNKKKNNTSANAPTADFVDAPNDKLVMLLDRLIKANPEMLIYICMYTLR